MAQILFYHLERSGLASVLPGLLEKTLQNDWTATVRVGSAGGVQEIDNLLWTYSDEAFLPHGVPGGVAGGVSGDTTDHPVWITDAPGALKPEAELLFLVHGAKAEIAELAGLTRCVAIFDGADEEAVMAARQFWKEAKAAEHEMTYWKQTQAGKWEKQG